MGTALYIVLITVALVCVVMLAAFRAFVWHSDRLKPEYEHKSLMVIFLTVVFAYGMGALTVVIFSHISESLIR